MESIPERWKYEIETLQAIYIDQFKLSPEPGKFEITVLSDPDSSDESHNLFSLIAEITLPQDYPDVLPIINLKPLKGVTLKEVKFLTQNIMEQAKEFIGTQMIFPLIHSIKEWLDEQNMHVLDKKKLSDREKEELEREKELEEYNKNFIGTPLTVENFKSWFTSFLASHPEKPQWEIKRASEKLTGKMIFENAALSNINLEILENEEDNSNVDWNLLSIEADLENLE